MMHIIVIANILGTRMLVLDPICVLSTPNVTVVSLQSLGMARAYGGFWGILVVMLVEGCLLRGIIVLYV
jgi:hypothetical protein